MFYDFIWAYMTGSWNWTVEDYLSYMASVLVSFNFLCKRSKKSLFLPLQHKGKKMALFQTCFFWSWTGPFTYLDWCLSLPHCCSSTSSNWSQKPSKNFSKIVPNIGRCWLENFQEDWLGEGCCLSLSVPSLPIRCSHFESYWLAASKLCSTTFFQCVK